MTVTACAVDGPSLKTVSVKVTVWPLSTVAGAAVFVIRRSAAWAEPPTSVAVLLAGLTSPPPATVAVLMIEAGAGSASVTSTKIGGKLSPSASAPERVQTSTRALIEQAQPSPPALANDVNAAGSGSVTVIVLPSLGRLPTLDTTIRIVETAPATKSGEWRLVSVMSGAATTLVTMFESAVSGIRRLCVT